MIFPKRSTVADMPGGTSVVVAVSSIAAGPSISAPGPSARPVEDCRLGPPALVEVDHPAARARGGRVAARRDLPQRRLRHRAVAGEAERHELGGHVEPERVETLVRVVEAAARPRRVLASSSGPSGIGTVTVCSWPW